MSATCKITVNKFRCAGSTQCVMDAPEIFALDEKAQARVINPDSTDREKILAVARACPMSAISVEDAETGEKLFP